MYFNTHNFTRLSPFKLFRISEAWKEVTFKGKTDTFQHYTRQEIANALKKSREESGYGRKEFAELLGLTDNTYKMYENSRRKLPLEIYLIVKQILKLDF